MAKTLKTYITTQTSCSRIVELYSLGAKDIFSLTHYISIFSLHHFVNLFQRNSIVHMTNCNSLPKKILVPYK